MPRAVAWAKRKRGTAKQVGKAFPVFDRTPHPFSRKSSPVTSGTKILPAKKSVFTNTNPLFKTKTEQPQQEEQRQEVQTETPFGTTPRMTEEERLKIEEEKDRENHTKVIHYWRRHPELSESDAIKQALKPIKSKEARETFNKITGGARVIAEKLHMVKPKKVTEYRRTGYIEKGEEI